MNRRRRQPHRTDQNAWRLLTHLSLLLPAWLGGWEGGVTAVWLNPLCPPFLWQQYVL